mgnify:CR=1 FL=1
MSEFLFFVRSRESSSLSSLLLLPLFLTVFRGGFSAFPPCVASVLALLAGARREEGGGGAALVLSLFVAAAAGAAAAAASLLSKTSPPPPPPLLLIDLDIATRRASLASAGAGGPSLRKREERVTRTGAASFPSPLFCLWASEGDSLASSGVFFFRFLPPLQLPLSLPPIPPPLAASSSLGALPPPAGARGAPPVILRR